MPDETLLLAVELRRDFHSGGGLRRRPKETVRAVDGVSFSVARGDALAVVGESGSGKTTLARLLVGLTPPTAGRIEFEGKPLDWASARTKSSRSKIQMIFQDPLGSLDPRWRVRDVVREPLDNFSETSKAERDAAVREVLEQVGIDDLQAAKKAPQLSGGQRQRVGIARAVVLRPKLVVCDEPVSALDVSIRGQILDLLSRLRREFGLTYIYISHDLSTVRKLCNRIMTMYLGEIVELAPTAEFFAQPFHPYAQALLSAVPIADPVAEERRQRIVLQGEVADATRVPSGCRFHPRCPLAQQICRSDKPELREVAPGRWARCHFAPDARVEASESTFTPVPVTSA